MEIRKARIEDSAAIACNVMAAMGYDVFGESLDTETQAMLEGMTEICAREDTLYSWRNTLVAVADEADCGLERSKAGCAGGTGPMVAGSLTSYDGAEYLAMRELTFGIAREKFGWSPPLMDDETQAGEWYMDSLAVHPSFRKRGIAQLLFTQTFEVAEALGFTKASLIALASADRLVAFYESIGFKPECHLNCFGHDYLRMVADI